MSDLEAIANHQRAGRRGNAHDIDVKEQIRQAAMAVFAECGFEGASINDIANRAGCTKPMVFYYFGSKDDLFYELFENMHTNSVCMLRRMLEEGDATLEERLCKIIDMNREYMAHPSGEMRFFQAMINGGAKSKELINSCHFHHVEEVFGLFEQAAGWAIEAGEISGDPHLIAAAVYSILGFGHIQCSVMVNNNLNAGNGQPSIGDVDLKELMKLLFRGLVVKPVRNVKHKKNTGDNK